MAATDEEESIHATLLAPSGPLEDILLAATDVALDPREAAVALANPSHDLDMQAAIAARTLDDGAAASDV